MSEPIYLQEHDSFPAEKGINWESISNSRLIQWMQFDKRPPGFYASYFIGAEWLGDDQAVVVTTKEKMERIDFLKMFSVCLKQNLDMKRFSSIYDIHPDQKPIHAESLRSVLSPLIIIHFLSMVQRICSKGLKHDYVMKEDNLKKVKGHIRMIDNERINVQKRRLNKIYCQYHEYSVDCSENRLLKKALMLADRMMNTYFACSCDLTVRTSIHKSLSYFNEVSTNIHSCEIRGMKSHKLYPEYKEAIRLAQTILRLHDLQITRDTHRQNCIIPFHIDMSLLYEFYIYGLLHDAYGNNIKYQFSSTSGVPDFLLISSDERLILDAKYKPKLAYEEMIIKDLRQLSGYGRDISILTELGVPKDSIVDCVIIYPEATEEEKDMNPFLADTKILSLPSIESCSDFVRMYKIRVSLPVVGG